MRRRIWRLLGELFGFSPSVDAELVGIANAMAGILIGGLLWWQLDLSIGGAIASAAFGFVGLTALLLSPNTYWVAALIGGTVLSVGPTVLLGAGGLALGSVTLGWVGAGLGFVTGTSLAFFSYRDLARKIGGGSAEPRA